MGEAHFPKGMEVEVSSDEEGFKGSWFSATVLRSASKKNKLFVEYRTLTADEEGLRPLREFVDVISARPPPPREIGRAFKLSEEVDAYHNDGWWEGVITKVLDNSRYSVYFRRSREELDFAQSDLRLHREWVDGGWVPPEEVEQTKSLKPEAKFSKGTPVEVSSDEDGFRGAWFAATIIKKIGKDKYLVEYQSLRTDDENELLREEVDALHIRPPPPDLPVAQHFKRLEEVDALYNDGWWVGVISKVLSDSRYIVYFRNTKEELEFGHSDLRLHQDWIDGKWVRASQVLKL